MTIGRQLGVGSCLLLSLSFTSLAGTVVVGRSGWFDQAQAQPQPSEEEKKRRERERQKGQPQPPPKGPPPAPRVIQPQPQPPKPPAPAMVPPPPPPPRAPPPPPPKAFAPPPPPPPPPAGQPPVFKQTTPPVLKPPLPKEGARTPDGPKPPAKSLAPGQAVPVSPDKLPPPAAKPGVVTPAPAMVPPPPAPGGVGTPPAARVLPPGPGPRRFDEVQKGRQERVEGNARVIQEPGNRTIIKQDNRVIIRHDEAERFKRRPGAQTERRPDGVVATFYARPDGTRVFTEVDAHGRLVRRYRRGPDGREHHIIDNRRFWRNVAIGVGVGAIGVALLSMAPPRVTLAREKYIVDYDRASDDDLYEALDAPPIERLDRAYSLEEIRYTYELRQRLRHIELLNISFEFGAWEISPEQYPKLERLARAMLRILRRNPDELFLIGGHTDAVGSDVDNLSLSDRRAASVAEVLSETFGVPPENLVTQGYGEQFLKVPTQGPEPLNRRVDVRRITSLMAEQ